jgi:hypothetical protein
MATLLLRPCVRFVPFAIAVVWGLTSLSIGFYADDYALLAFLERRVPLAPSAWDLYRFAPNDAAVSAELRALGVLPWWVAPGLSLHLFRPLSSVLFAFDHVLFGGQPAGYHLHSILWYVALVAIVSMLHARLLTRPTARLATILYAASGAHFMPWAWISARHLEVSAVFACFGLFQHLRWREDGVRWAALVAPVSLLLALLAGESGVGGIVFVVSYELLARRRLAPALPACAVLAVHAALYVAVGAGARNGAGYVDPLSDPIGYALIAAERLPLLVGNALLALPAELFVYGLTAPLIGAGLIGLLLFALAARRAWPLAEAADRRHLPWLIAGAACCLVPMVAGFPGSRQLILPNLAFCALFAALIRAGIAARAVPRALAWALVVLHGLFSPLFGLFGVHTLSTQARRIESIAASADLSGPKQRPLFVIASDPMVFLYVTGVLVLGERVGSCWATLSAAKGTHRIERTAPDTLRMEVEGSTFMLGAFETVYRSDKFPFRVGDSVEQCGARIRVLETRSGRPSQVEVRFDVPLDSDALRIVAWQSGRLARLRIPQTGATRIPWSAGPMGGL